MANFKKMYRYFLFLTCCSTNLFSSENSRFQIDETLRNSWRNHLEQQTFQNSQISSYTQQAVLFQIDESLRSSWNNHLELQSLQVLDNSNNYVQQSSTITPAANTTAQAKRNLLLNILKINKQERACHFLQDNSLNNAQSRADYPAIEGSKQTNLPVPPALDFKATLLRSQTQTKIENRPALGAFRRAKAKQLAAVAQNQTDEIQQNLFASKPSKTTTLLKALKVERPNNTAAMDEINAAGQSVHNIVEAFLKSGISRSLGLQSLQKLWRGKPLTNNAFILEYLTKHISHEQATDLMHGVDNSTAAETLLTAIDPESGRFAQNFNKKS